MMGWYDGWGGGGWLAMTLMMVFWITLIALAIWAAVRFAGNGPAAVTTTPTPRAILDHRLAAGEIDAEQYAQLRRLLEGQSAGPVPTDTK